jgi:circadian clock protein KaiB
MQQQGFDTRSLKQEVHPYLSSKGHFILRLYVTGMMPYSSRAITTLRCLCEKYLSGRYDLDVIDLYQHPEMARGAEIVVIPTLIKEQPLPVRRIIGDLSDEDRVLKGLDLHGVVQVLRTHHRVVTGT